MTRGRSILALNAFDPRQGTLTDSATAALVERRRQALAPMAMLFYDRPLNVVAAQDVWIETSEGTRYLDFYNNVPSVGHANPRVTAAVSKQMATVNVHTRYLHDIVQRYADRLLATLPAGLDKVAFTCTGSESNDLALRLATAATGRRGFVVTEGAYHGNTAAVTDVSPSSRPGQPLAPHVRSIPAPLDALDDGLGFAAALRSAIADLDESGFGFAGLLVDTIFSSDGVAADPAGFLRPAVEATRRAGGLFIADEVQPGFGRTGAGLWGFERHGVVPDIVTMGKPMGNGVPIGAVVSRMDLMTAFAASVGYFNTFGGNPVSAAAGLAVLEEIEERGLIANAASVGDALLGMLHAIEKRHPAIGAVRGAGLYIGIEIVADGEPSPEIASRLINTLRERGILIGAAGLFGNVLKIRPPLVIAREHAARLMEELDQALGDVRT